MPGWCETCDRRVDGEACEVCGGAVVEPERMRLDWKWRFFGVSTVIYLIWRLYQLIHWLTS